jgi:hypothetical protein
MDRIEEHPYPDFVKATKDGARNLHCLQISSYDDSIGVMYAEEPWEGPDKGFGKHISITYCLPKGAAYPCAAVRARVKLALEKKGLSFPKKYTITVFKEGFFAGKGIHVWEE